MARLRKITVTPPEMFAKSGQQTVGWRFVVRRTINEGDYPSHQVTYTSPIQTRTATTSEAADFDLQRVAVTLSTSVEDQRDVFYQVVLKLYWYRANGSVQSSTTYLMPDYTVRVKGPDWQYTEGGWNVCDAVQWAIVN
jgi:hypothetical protein